MHRRDLTLALAALYAGTLLAPVAARSSAQRDQILTLWRAGDPGERLEIRGRVRDAGGELVPAAEVGVRHADAGGEYTGAYEGSMLTDARGEYILRTVVPGSYGRPRHIHVFAQHPQAGHAYTEILFKGDPLLQGGQVEMAIALETVRLGGREHKVGTFDIVLSR
jgi:protocatechuate 3,4-dioxygenase beta subunit